MYLLKKIIQLRENSHPDHEKPFLEHLEDLRVMITRVILTLVIAMVVCFVFQKQLMEILRRPVEQVWIHQVEAKLPGKAESAPKPLDVDLWEQAKQAERAAVALEPTAREAFYKACGPDLAFHTRSVALLRATLVLPEDKRADFLAGLSLPKDLAKQVRVLLESAPSPDIDSRGNLRLMSALRPTETFMLSMKLSFFAGIVVSFPLLLMFVLQFVLPGLHMHERRLLWPALLVGFGLFLAGVFFAYYVVLPRALEFFYEWSGSLGVSNDWRIGEYISFATQFTLLFGLSFELPVVVMVLVKLGLLTYETMSKTRSYAVLAIFVTAAVLTPTPDAFTLMLMALPMLVLYEICIWLAWLDKRKNRISEEQEARESEERRLASMNDENAEETPTEQFQADEAGDDGYTPEYEQQDHHEYSAYDAPEEPAADDHPTENKD